MIIISHRGYWKDPAEKNKPIAFSRSFDLEFGTETDIRDFHGKLVISHDMPDGSEMTLDEMLRILQGRDLPIAVNIKADGLSVMIEREFEKYGHKNWFTFDMSGPELISQIKNKMPAFTRVSEYEPDPICYERSQGIWLDAFDSDWFEMERVEKYLRDGKRVCIVSPELHRRESDSMWKTLRSSSIVNDPNLMLCTDKPEEARRWFEGVS